MSATIIRFPIERVRRAEPVATWNPPQVAKAVRKRSKRSMATCEDCGRPFARCEC